MFLMKILRISNGLKGHVQLLIKWLDPFPTLLLPHHLLVTCPTNI